MSQRAFIGVSIRSVRPVVTRLAIVGIDPAQALVAVGIDPSALEDPEARIPHAAALELWNEAVHLSDDEAFGLHVAEDVRSGAFDVLDYAIRASATLGEGFARLSRYHRILHDAAVVQVRVDGDHAWLEHVLPPEAGVLPRHVAEFIVATWLVVARQATALDFAPDEVSFRHSAPKDQSEHRRLFRAPVRFSAATNALRVGGSLLSAPLVKSDAGLCAVLEHYAKQLLDRLPAGMSISARARHLVAETLASGTDSDAVARRMHMSRRTLHRQLAAEGVSFKDLVDDLRRELATRYLAEPRMAVAEVAFLLGFSETSAFHRAFKRWHGVTPAEHRRRRYGDR